ncbi:MAG: hypothetical protein M3Y69_03500 [Verrucomicrobiota bacterium]|nr:hypothetical protein [Verrucomicrobiota bacterium]
MNASRAFRIAVALLAMAAWFVASDHCALAGALQKRATASAAHQHCPGHPAPGKKGSGEDLPCCKSLLATSVAPVKNAVGGDAKTFVLQQYSSIESLLALWHSDPPVTEIDPGPPHGDAFAVTERSVLAHAPPVSLG